MTAKEPNKKLKPSQETYLREWLAQNWKRDPISAAILLLAWDAGLSSGEISSLRWESVDLSAGLLELGERRIPLEPVLEDLLNDLVGKSIYVIPNGRSHYTPMNRVSVSRRARQALNHAGMPDITLADLRNDFMLRIMVRLPMEQVVEISGYDVRSVQEFARRYGVCPPGLSTGKKGGSELATGVLLNALQQEGDTLDSRVVVLSWLGGLTLEQMSRLKWEEISLSDQIWVIDQQESHIPKDLLPYLEGWRHTASNEIRLLHGPRSDRPVSIHDLSRRGKEFFIRYHFPGYSLALLRGKAEPALMHQRIMELMQEKGRLSTGSVAAAMEISLGSARKLLKGMVEQGDLSSAGSGVYQLLGETGPYQRLTAFLLARKGQTVTRRELSDLLKKGDGSVTYYIEKARKDHLLERSGHGKYRVL